MIKTIFCLIWLFYAIIFTNTKSFFCNSLKINILLKFFLLFCVYLQIFVPLYIYRFL